MPIYRVSVTREERTDILVEADSVAEAEEEALELSCDARIWEEVWSPTTDGVELQEDQYPTHEEIWTGGGQGHEFHFEETASGALKRVNH